MEEIHDVFKEAGGKMVGYWPTEGYQHEESKVLLDSIAAIHLWGWLLIQSLRQSYPAPLISKSVLCNFMTLGIRSP